MDSTTNFRSPRLRGLGIAFAAVAVAGMSACGGGDSPPAPAPGPAPAPTAVTVSNPTAACTALASTTVPATAIGLPTQGATITSATLQAADSTTGFPEYCKVLGSIAAVNSADPPIKFQLNLPTTWNVKTLQYGGGGFNGTVITGLGGLGNGGASLAGAPHPLARGYATYGGDSGHSSPGGTFFANDQAAANYGGQSVKRTRDAAVYIEKAYYNATPWKVYYQGGSKGGQEGLHAAQDYGSDFDGVIALYPAAQNPGLPIAWQRMWVAAYRTPGGYLNRAKQALVQSSVLQACDALDGATDGIVSNTTACANSFNLGVLRCPGGADTGDTCLSDAQMDTLLVAASPTTLPMTLKNGVTSVGAFPVLQGGMSLGDVSAWLDATGVGTATAYYAFLDGTIKYFFYGDGSASSDGFDWAAWPARALKLSSYYDASSPNLDTFKSRGGKLLMLQGTTDMLVTPAMTNAYFQALVTKYGTAVPDFVRYFVVPGYGHAAGVFNMTWDSVSALEAWAEKGQAPVGQVTVDSSVATAGRSRPLCEFGSYPKYSGSGDINSAASYTCSPL